MTTKNKIAKLKTLGYCGDYFSYENQCLTDYFIRRPDGAPVCGSCTANSTKRAWELAVADEAKMLKKYAARKNKKQKFSDWLRENNN